MNAITQRETLVAHCRKTRFPQEAYNFVWQQLGRLQHSAGGEGQARYARNARPYCSGRALLESIRKQLLLTYGPFAIDVLHHWNIQDSKDIGTIVFDLVDMKLIAASRSRDRPEDFDGVDLEADYVQPFK